MGFHSRSVSLTRYRIKGRIDGHFWEAVDDGLKRGAFREIETTGDVVAEGWTSIDDFADATLESAAYVRGEYAAWAFRQDTARVPAKILDMQFRKESRKILEQSQRRRLSRAQAGELKEQLKEQLRKQVLPSIQTVDIVWNTNDGVVYVCTHAIKARERIEELFKKSFGLTIIPLIPYLRAQEILQDSDKQKLLESLIPCSMA